MEEFLSQFEFGSDLKQVLSENDLLLTTVEGEKPLLLSLTQEELHQMLLRSSFSLGRRKLIWRKLKQWKVSWYRRQSDSQFTKNAVIQDWGPNDNPNNTSDDEMRSTDLSDSEDESSAAHKRSKCDILNSHGDGGNAQTEVRRTSVNQSSSHLNGSNTNCPNCGQRNKMMATSLTPKERWKTLLAFLYVLVVSWLTAFVMVIVHDRVPDMDKYPPLPDLLLDNLPHIPWAFEICEMTGMMLLTLWIMVCVLHKHRFILMRRFFSISGTIFLLRCVTMLITSLSVPGKHLTCAPRPYGDIWNKLYNAYVIWTGAGMTLQGVRTCGDYMFSGHTVSLTLLNFFITEYTSRRIYFLHTFTWICNVFGVFFILAAHEHYSIDVFIAFYITSRLFLYYHTLANNKGNGKVGQRAWFYFPLFYFFEINIEGKIPNEFEWPVTLHDIKEGWWGSKSTNNLPNQPNIGADKKIKEN